MKHPSPPRRQQGMTLVEITLVISVLLGMTTVVALTIGSMANWKLGRSAGEDLRSVYLAQKSYLADHPTDNIAEVSKAELEKYLPSGMPTISPVEDLEGNNRTINFNEMPPVIGDADNPYDPSPETNDGVWDVGKK